MTVFVIRFTQIVKFTEKFKKSLTNKFLQLFMKYLILFIIVFSQVEISLTQISSSDSKKITKILGENFIELTPQKSYPYSSLNKNVIADTSLVVPDDTTGIYFNNEFLLFRSSIHFKEGSEIKKMMKTNYVSVAEYQEFQNYVRDSIAREILILGLAEDTHAEKYVLYDSKLIKEKKLEIGSYDRVAMRKVFPLNWQKKISYTDLKNQEIMPLLEGLYLERKKRFYNGHDFDKWKFIYKYNPNINAAYYEEFDSSTIYADKLAIKKDVEISTFAKNYLWTKGSNSLNDQQAIFAQVYERLFVNYPVIGLNANQVIAFCHWKETKIQKEFKRKNLNFSLVISLPTYHDVKEFNSNSCYLIREHNYSQQWQISNEEYEHYIKSVQDSILREFFYFEVAKDDVASEYIDYKDSYYDDVMRAWLDFDNSDRKENRLLFNLNLKTKFKNKNDKEKSILDFLKNNGIYKKPQYKYFYIDVKQLTLNDNQNMEKFIIKIEIPILPDSTSTETQIIKKITYEQALAFYHWKYPIHKIKATDNWQDFVLPSKEQFEKIKRGEQIIVEEKKVEFPSPVFRYVVHIYPK
ncbi:MAG: hypothetical protein V4622_10125 [Bacteroidota bacterium]